MKPNIGLLNALIRITIGFVMLTWVTPKMVWRPFRDSYLLFAICGAMKIAEGIVRYCPVTALIKQYQDQQENEKNEETEQSITINPS